MTPRAPRSSDTTPIEAFQIPTPAPSPTPAKSARAERMLDHLRQATLGQYEILAELGAGGMATVFLAHDLQLDRRVAVKLMHPALIAGEGMAERFLLEARTAAGLSHPNIIPIYAVRVEEDLLFFVMKFVEGRPLDSIIVKEAPLAEEMVRQIISEVASALAYAHHRGVIHRDIKPANIMISTDGQPILTDFGIAKVADKQGLTMTGATIGTPTYMSPEQCNALPLTGASDQYSLGIMAYEMLTGRPPFDADSVMTIMYKHINEPVMPVREKVASCSPDLAAAIDRMLAKEPGDRFPDIQDVVAAMEAPSSTSENAVRTQLVQFALAGANREVLKRVSTPRSPIPSMARPKSRIAAPTVVAPAEKKGSRIGLLIGVGVVAIGAVALAVTQPWKSRAAPAPRDSIVSVNVVPGPDTTTSAVTPPPVVDTPSTPVQSTTPPPRAATRPPPATVTAPASVTTLRVVGSTTLSIGGTTTLQAEPYDEQGKPMTGRPVSWSSSAPDIVFVSASGQLIARDVGRATITATVDGKSQSVAVTVSQDPIASIALSPGSISLDPGETASLSAQVRSGSGRVLEGLVEWSSGSPDVASVASDGKVTAHGAGTAVITGSAGGKQATATVTVRDLGPTDAQLKAQVSQAILGYAGALQAKDIARVRSYYPGMTAAREQQLRQALPAMDNLQVRLSVGSVDLAGANATARVTGNWVFSTEGRRTTLPADNTYMLERRGNSWVITDIR
ncbi:MAG TPA: protein kinase [Gemmatimonadales bacterium]|nr:protein kinase [Gemmatimonadales bacterium]